MSVKLSRNTIHTNALLPYVPPTSNYVLGQRSHAEPFPKVDDIPLPPYQNWLDSPLMAVSALHTGITGSDLDQLGAVRPSSES
jgi:hypothetical protein